MSTETGIAWTHIVNPDGSISKGSTWNPIRGCSRVSEGCRHCYAERVATRFSGPGKPYEGLVTKDGRWNGTVRFVEEHLLDPLRWTRPRMIFVNSMSDLFHEALTDAQIDRVVEVMARADRHVFQVLTKRPERMRDYLNTGERWRLLARQSAPATLDDEFAWPLPNVWWGVSVEDQKTADARIPVLLETEAAVRWVSYEPALGPIDFERGGFALHRPVTSPSGKAWPGLDWIVVGGESGDGARPFDLAWAEQTIAAGAAAGVPVFVKQLGKVVRHHGQPVWGGRGKGDDVAAWPPHLRVREYPINRLMPVAPRGAPAQ